MERRARPPAELRGAAQRDLTVPPRAGASQRLAQDRLLQLELRRVVQLLIRAAAAARDIGARRGAAAGAGLEEGLGDRPRITGSDRFHPHAQAVARHGSRHQDDLALVARQTEAAVHAFLDRHLGRVARLQARASGHG